MSVDIVTLDYEVIYAFVDNGTSRIPIIVNDTLEFSYAYMRENEYYTEGSIIPSLWYSSICILTKNNQHYYVMLSSHSEEYRRKSDQILKSRIIPCPRPVYLDVATFDKDPIITLKHIERGSDMLYYETYRQAGIPIRDVIGVSPLKDQLYGVVGGKDHITLMKSTLNYKVLFLNTRSRGIKLSYIRISPSDTITWLYGDVIEYKSSYTLDDLKPYTYRLISKISIVFIDIDIVLYK